MGRKKIANKKTLHLYLGGDAVADLDWLCHLSKRNAIGFDLPNRL